jgi:small subunit ribosomal protein S1
MAEEQQKPTDATEVAEPDQVATESTGDGDVGRVLEDAVSEATDSVDVPSAGEAGVTTEERELVTSVGSAQDLPEASIGYTGEIVGRVLTLAELDDADEETRQRKASYSQLEKLVDKTFTMVTEHEIVRGRVVSIGEKDAVIDIGFKSDGIVSLGEWDRELVAGDEVEVYLERLEDYHGQLVLSKTKADQVRRWQRIEDAFENEEVLEGTIIRRIKGGMIVELFGDMEAFLPGSQIDVRPVRDFDAYLERRMEFKIVKLNPANENIVVSHKALIEKELQAQREKILGTMEVGQVLEGQVKNIVDFGVFIDLGGVDGLLHITDLSWGRVSHPSELVELDQKLNVVVLDYDKERQRISLGLKQLQSHPWDDLAERYNEGDVVEGKVVSITDYGAFVELEKGIEGLVHISEMSWTEHIRHPSQMVSLGQLVNVKILNIDHDGKKISLGMKQLEPDPWQGISDRYPPGTVMRGKVRNITNFGVFVEIEPGIDGLVHISDLSWTKKIRHPAEMVKKGQEMDVVILNIDESQRRISLGHKQVQTNPWTTFAQTFYEGADTEGKVIGMADGGLLVELPMEVEAFVPASELKQGTHFDQFYNEGDKLELRVIRFDPNNKEIVLSETAKHRAEETEARSAEKREKRVERERETREVRQYTEKQGSAASGPTTLGELSGLASLKAQIEEAEAQAGSTPDEASAVVQSEEAAVETTDEAAGEEPTQEAAAEETTEVAPEAVAAEEETEEEEAPEAVAAEEETEAEEAPEAVAAEEETEVEEAPEAAAAEEETEGEKTPEAVAADETEGKPVAATQADADPADLEAATDSDDEEEDAKA